MTQPMTGTSDAAAERTPAFVVPRGETPEETCRLCGRPFTSERALALHLGERHEADLGEVEAAAFEQATALEDDELFVYHAKVVGALGAIYSVTVILYMIAFSSGFI